MNEDELIGALNVAREIEPAIWRIQVSLNEAGVDVIFYNSTLQGKVIYGYGDGDTLRESVDAALDSIRENNPPRSQKWAVDSGNIADISNRC